MQNTDVAWMRHAIRLAEYAEQQGEVPVGAVLVKNGHCIAEGWNGPICHHDPTAHAEIMAIREAGKKLQNYRLVDTTLYVTLEPCVMCIGAVIHARITRLVFGADDPKRGAVCHAFNMGIADFLNHKISWSGGVMGDVCGDLLRDFFRSRR
jgi:tRNA(adenine34) deaminase